MTTASQGLGKALARAGASGGVIAIAEMSSAELLAAMTDEQKAGLSAALPAAAAPGASAAHPEPDPSEPDGDQDDTACSKCKEPMKDGKCAKCEASASAEAAHEGTPAYAAGFAAATARAVAVMSDDHAAANPKGAVKLLGNANLSADEITGLLADLKPAAQGEAADPEGAARDEMRQAISETANSGIDANAGAVSGTPATANSQNIWDKAIAANNPGLKRN